jgi:hypothetical protein
VSPRPALLRRAAVAAAVLLAVVALPACGKKNQDRQKVLGIIHATEAKASRFLYTEQRTTGRTEVDGLQEDDLRYKAEVSYDGQPSYDEVVDDDAIAVRMIDPSVLERLVDQHAPTTLKTTTDVSNLSVLDALRTHRWVEDKANAPSALDTQRLPQDTDPVLDARTTLAYVEKAITEAFSVQKWQPDALQPAYPSSEDTFPKPAKGSGVDRYDLLRPFLPAAAAQQTAAGGQNALPATKHFRKMAIYVKDGLIIRVLEKTEVIGKQVGELESYLKALIKQAPSGEQGQIRASFDKLIAQTTPSKLGSALLGVVDAVLLTQGLAPINARTMSLELVDTGKNLTIQLPSDQIVHGNLLVLLIAGSNHKVAKSTSGATFDIPGVTGAPGGGTNTGAGVGTSTTSTTGDTSGSSTTTSAPAGPSPQPTP